MNIHLLRRRQLLWYFGLGVGAATLGVGHKKAVISASTPTSTNNDTSTSTKKVAASPTERSFPELQGITQWLNSPPLNLTDLKGNVVLVQFWTFACINCQRTLPYITRWHRQYASKGLKVVGIHTPEFRYERDVNNVKAALKRHKVSYPVPLDNDYKTWEAYENQYWPHLFLVTNGGSSF